MSDGPYALVDIDGVLADVRHRVHFVERRPKDWDRFFASAPDDPALPEGLAVVAELVERGLALVYLTGRPERCREDTLAWFARHGLPSAPLLMRSDRDRRPARATKLEVARRLRAERGVAVVVDDDRAVVATLRDDGFEVLHATWMDGGTDGVDATTVQEALFAAQEDEGRT